MLMLAVVLPLAASRSATASTSAEVGRFIEIAERTKLAERLAWRRLLHYRGTLWGGVESEVDDATFFLSAAGADDPNAELKATIRGWFAPAPHDAEQHAICRFPARYAWLKERLGLPPRPDIACRAQRAFVRRFAAHRVSVIFAANSLRHPESALGHTFLLLEDDDPATEDITIDYRVKTDDKTPILYSFKGLTGLHIGRFELAPRNERLLSILTEEHRDLWRFELELSSKELERFVMHLWELEGTKIRYYYLTENCSYHALSALEAAAPRLELLEQAKFVVVPLDTIRALFREPGLVARTHYYPAAAIEPSETSDSSADRMRRFTPPPAMKAVEHGHGPLRWSYGTGYASNHGVFGTVGFRLVYHDLLDPPLGAPELLQIQALDLKVRYSPEPNLFTIDDVTFIDLMSISPVDSASPLAWRVRAFGDRIRDESCQDSEDCFMHGVALRLGASFASDDRAVALFVLPGMSVTFSGDVDGIGGSDVRLALGPFGGLRVRLAPRMVGLLTGRWDYLPWQTLDSSFDARAELRWGLARDVAVAAHARLQPSAAESGLTSYVYF